MSGSRWSSGERGGGGEREASYFHVKRERPNEREFRQDVQSPKYKRRRPEGAEERDVDTGPGSRVGGYGGRPQFPGRSFSGGLERPRPTDRPGAERGGGWGGYPRNVPRSESGGRSNWSEGGGATRPRVSGWDVERPAEGRYGEYVQHGQFKPSGESPFGKRADTYFSDHRDRHGQRGRMERDVYAAGVDRKAPTLAGTAMGRSESEDQYTPGGTQRLEGAFSRERSGSMFQSRFPSDSDAQTKFGYNSAEAQKRIGALSGGYPHMGDPQRSKYPQPQRLASGGLSRWAAPTKPTHLDASSAAEQAAKQAESILNSLQKRDAAKALGGEDVAKVPGSGEKDSGVAKVIPSLSTPPPVTAASVASAATAAAAAAAAASALLKNKRAHEHGKTQGALSVDTKSETLKAAAAKDSEEPAKSGKESPLASPIGSTGKETCESAEPSTKRKHSGWGESLVKVLGKQKSEPEISVSPKVEGKQHEKVPEVKHGDPSVAISDAAIALPSDAAASDGDESAPAQATTPCIEVVKTKETVDGVGPSGTGPWASVPTVSPRATLLPGDMSTSAPRATLDTGKDVPGIQPDDRPLAGATPVPLAAIGTLVASPTAVVAAGRSADEKPAAEAALSPGTGVEASAMVSPKGQATGTAERSPVSLPAGAGSEHADQNTLLAGGTGVRMEQSTTAASPALPHLVQPVQVAPPAAPLMADGRPMRAKEVILSEMEGLDLEISQLEKEMEALQDKAVEEKRKAEEEAAAAAKAKEETEAAAARAKEEAERAAAEARKVDAALRSAAEKTSEEHGMKVDGIGENGASKDVESSKDEKVAEPAGRSQRVLKRILEENLKAAQKSERELLDAIGNQKVKESVGAGGRLYSCLQDGPNYSKNIENFAKYAPAIEKIMTQRRQQVLEEEWDLSLEYRKYQEMWKQERWAAAKAAMAAKEEKEREREAAKGNQSVRRDRNRGEPSRASSRLRGAGNVFHHMGAVRSEYEEQQILLQLAAAERLKTMVKIPPMIMDEEEQRWRQYINDNRRIHNPVAEEEERQGTKVWTEEEKRLFMDKFLQYNKNFRRIASEIEGRTTGECVCFYYRNQKTPEFARIRKKQQLKKRAVKANTNSNFLRTQGKTADETDTKKNKDEKEAPKSKDKGQTTPIPKSSKESKKAGPSQSVKGARGKPDKSEKGGKAPKGSKVKASASAGKADQKEDGGPSENVWNDAEREAFLRAVTELGDDFKAVAARVGTKTAAKCKSYFNKNKKQLGLESIVNEAKLKGPRGDESKIGNGKVTVKHEQAENKPLTSASQASEHGAPPGTVMGSTDAAVAMEVDEMPGATSDKGDIVGGHAMGEKEGAHKERRPQSYWTQDEKDTLIETMKEHGRDWTLLQKRIPTKSLSQIKNFYQNYKSKYRLTDFVNSRRSGVKTELGGGNATSATAQPSTDLVPPRVSSASSGPGPSMPQGGSGGTAAEKPVAQLPSSVLQGPGMIDPSNAGLAGSSTASLLNPHNLSALNALFNPMQQQGALPQQLLQMQHSLQFQQLREMLGQMEQLELQKQFYRYQQQQAAQLQQADSGARRIDSSEEAQSAALQLLGQSLLSSVQSPASAHAARPTAHDALRPQQAEQGGNEDVLRQQQEQMMQMAQQNLQQMAMSSGVNPLLWAMMQQQNPGYLAMLQQAHAASQGLQPSMLSGSEGDQMAALADLENRKAAIAAIAAAASGGTVARPSAPAAPKPQRPNPNALGILPSFSGASLGGAAHEISAPSATRSAFQAGASSGFAPAPRAELRAEAEREAEELRQPVPSRAVAAALPAGSSKITSDKTGARTQGTTAIDSTEAAETGKAATYTALGKALPTTHHQEARAAPPQGDTPGSGPSPQTKSSGEAGHALNVDVREGSGRRDSAPAQSEGTIDVVPAPIPAEGAGSQVRKASEPGESGVPEPDAAPRSE